VPDPLGLYIRAGRNDQGDLLDLIAAGDASCFGVVFDPTLVKSQRELREQVLASRLDAILDPRTQVAAMPGGFTESLGKLPWGGNTVQNTSDFAGTAGKRRVSALADFVLENGFTQVLAPTHLLDSAYDEWLAIDLENVRVLRNRLNRDNGATVPIIYSLAITNAMLRDMAQRQVLVEALRTIPISAVWLKVDGFGSDSTGASTRAYLDAANDFQELGLPVIADYVGGLVSLSLLAFGAVGGISHGVTQGMRFYSRYLRQPRIGEGFGLGRRIYVPQLDLLLKPDEAKALLGVSPRAKAKFGCSDTHCCPRGVIDMVENPGRHFLYQRIKEVSGLSQVPESLRPQRFLEEHMRPATDAVLTAANLNWQDEDMAKKMSGHRKRLDLLRIALGKHARTTSSPLVAYLPKTRAARDARI
jgi:hypothetical protein